MPIDSFPSSRRRRIVAAGVVLAVAALPVGDRADAATGQLTLFAYTGVQAADTYWQPPVAQPADYTAPVDLAAGRAYLKLDVTSKPSAKAMQPQVCFWRDGATRLQYETCSSANALTFTRTGTYWLDLGTPERWWTKSDGYDWSKQASVIRIMLKDPVTGSLFLGSRCGAACYKGDDLADHVPVQFRGEFVMVAKGATLSPPSGWAGRCPAAWSPQCTGGGGGGSGAPVVSVAAGARSFTASWPAVAGARRYQLIWRRVGGVSTPEPLFSATRYTVTGLAPGTYVVNVRANVAGVWSAFDSERVTIG